MPVTSPPSPQPSPAPRRWRFGLRTLMLACIAVAALLSFGMFVPGIVVGSVRVVVLAAATGVCMAGLMHRFDRANIVCAAALAGFVAAQLAPGDSSVLSSSLVDSLRWLPVGEARMRLSFLLTELLSPLEPIFVAVLAAWFALRTAPRWRRWATQDAGR